MHRSWMFLHKAGTSTPISASLLRRAFKLHLLPVPPPPPRALPFAGKVLPVLNTASFVLPARLSSALAAPALAAIGPAAPLFVPVALGTALLAGQRSGVESTSPGVAPQRSGERSGTGAAPDESMFFSGVSSSLSASSTPLTNTEMVGEGVESSVGRQVG